MPVRQQMLLDTVSELKEISVSPLFSNLTQSELLLMREIRIKTRKNMKESTVKTLAEQMNISPPAVSRSLHTLIEKGMVQKTINIENRRSSVVVLTDHGNEIYDKASHVLKEFAADVFEKVGEEDFRKLHALISKLHHVVKTELTEMGTVDLED